MKIKNSLLFVICLCFMFCSIKKGITECDYTKEYYRNVISAEIAYEQNDYERAYNLYKIAFDRCSPRNTRTFNEIDKMARVTAILDFQSECLKMIKLQINDGFTISKYSNDSLFNKVLNSKEGLKLISEYDSLRANFTKSINNDVVDMINEMTVCDQKYRKDRETYDKFRAEQNKLDSINEKKLITFFEKYDYPQDKLIINSNLISNHFLTIEGVLLHTKDSIRVNYFLPKIKKFVESGKCDPLVYAQLYDQYFLYNGEPQIFGTYKNNEGDLSNHIDLEILNANRKNIGLPTLEEATIIHQLKIQNYPESYGKFFKK